MNNGVSSVSGARLADRWVYRVGYAGNPIDFAQKIDFAEIVKVEGRTIELKLNSADAALTASPPNVPDHFLFRPRIETSVGTVRGGTVFAAQLPGDSRAILFTALHVFGPPGGLESEPEAKDLPAAVKKVVLTGLFDPSETVEAGAIVLPLPRAGRLGTQSRSGDVVAILASAAAKLQPRPLADRLPVSGEPVWLAARVLSGAPPDQRLHAATAKGVDEDGLLLYEFESPKTEIRATSGAPVLNAAGEVVAIQAGSASEGEKLIGVGTPVTKFAAELRRVLQQGRQPGMKESPRKNTARTRRRTP